ncbi:hypothetical protein KM043_002097 [Ampulex compressa]|nr:hypothetical protein KM043_002097 [Ampulex compressa]
MRHRRFHARLEDNREHPVLDSWSKGLRVSPCISSASRHRVTITRGAGNCEEVSFRDYEGFRSTKAAAARFPAFVLQDGTSIVMRDENYKAESQMWLTARLVSRGRSLPSNTLEREKPQGTLPHPRLFDLHHHPLGSFIECGARSGFVGYE